MLFSFGLEHVLMHGQIQFAPLSFGPNGAAYSIITDPTVPSNQNTAGVFTMPVPGTFKNLYVWLDGGLAEDEPGTCEIWINGANDTLGVDFGNDPTDSAVQYTDLISTTHVNAGDLVCMHIVNASALHNTTVSGTMLFVPD